MEDKRELLKHIGWSDELIDKCLSGEIILEEKISLTEYYVPTAFEQNTTNLIVNINTPIISDGTHLNK
jgi:hypothetical protein